MDHREGRDNTSGQYILRGSEAINSVGDLPNIFKGISIDRVGDNLTSDIAA